MSLAELRKKSQGALETFKKTMSEEKSNGGGGDNRFWKPFFDKEKGAGYSVIRFMPAPEGEDYPWVKLFSHGFKGPTGKWYVENSLTTLPGRTEDPVSQLNRSLWNSGIESDKQVARDQKRKTKYYANIMVVEDKENPEAVGKVFLYQFGPKIYEMLEDAMNPDTDSDPDLTPLNPFDPWGGADFVIKAKGQQLGTAIVPNYDKSYFKAPAAMGDDDLIEARWKECHSLQEFVQPKSFKTFEELQKRLFEVLGPTCGSGVPTVEGWDAPAPTPAAKPQASAQKPAVPDDDIPFDINSETGKVNESPKMSAVPTNADDDDDMAFFENLVNS